MVDSPENLVNYLIKFEISYEPKLPCCTKRTRHRTTSLGTHTEGISTRKMPHNHRFNHLIIMCFEKEFCRLSLRICFLRMKRERSIKTVFRKKIPDILRESFYLREICKKILIKSIFELCIAKLFMPILLKQSENLVFIMNRKQWKKRKEIKTLYSEEDSCCSKSDNSSYKCLYRSMSYRFIEMICIMFELIEYSRMESCLKTNIHSIIDDDYRKY